MRYDPSTMLMQTVDRHNKKIEELMKRVKELEQIVKSPMETAEKRGPGRPRKDAQ